MNKKMVLMISAVLLLGTFAGSGTISYMVANTDAEHKVSAGNLNVKLIESEKQAAKVVPGERIDYPVKVKNTGDYPLYAKITVKKYWSEDNKKYYNGNSSLITLLNKNGDDWIIDEKPIRIIKRLYIFIVESRLNLIKRVQNLLVRLQSQRTYRLRIAL